MRSATFNPFTTLLVPAVVPLALAIVAVQEAWVPDALERWFAALPLVLFAAILLLAWRFNLSRLALAGLVLAAAHQALSRIDSGTSGYHLVTALLPFNLAVVAWSSERGLTSWRGSLRAAAVVVEVGVAVWLIREQSTALAGLLDGWLPWSPAWLAPLGSAAVVAYGLALVALVGRFWRGRTTADGAFLGMLAGSALLATAAPEDPAFDVYSVALGLVLLVALVELSHALAYRDELTGLPGRRAFNDALKRLPRRYTVAMVDVDHFKRFNDRYGHEVGDQALRMVASRLARVTGGGRSYRYGGEEFSVVFLRKDANQAAPHLEALRKAIAGSPFAVRGANRPKRTPKRPRPRATTRKVRVTVSIGAASRDGRRPDADAVVLAADKLLYRAKKNGRNRVEC